MIGTTFVPVCFWCSGQFGTLHNSAAYPRHCQEIYFGHWVTIHGLGDNSGDKQVHYNIAKPLLSFIVTAVLKWSQMLKPHTWGSPLVYPLAYAGQQTFGKSYEEEYSGQTFLSWTSRCTQLIMTEPAVFYNDQLEIRSYVFANGCILYYMKMWP